MKTSFYIEILKDLIKTEYAPRTVNLSSCNDLAFDIFHRTGDTISVSTLLRFFDIVSKKSAISVSSLNILSAYVNYLSWDDFCKKQDNPNLKFHENYFPDEMGLRLFDIGLKNHNFSTTLQYLKGIPVDIIDEVPSTVYKMSSILGHVFRKDPVARKTLLPELAKTEQGRLFFYENFVDVEWHNGYYADAMFYYKKHINYNNKEISNRDFVFANTIEINDYLRRNRKKQAIKGSYDLIKKINPKEANPQTIGHIIPTARYYATYMIYLFLTKSLTDKKVAQIFASIDSLINTSDLSSPNTFIISELFRSLRYCKRYHDVIGYYENYNKSDIAFDYSDKYYPTIIDAVKMSYQETGSPFKAEVLIN